MKNRICIILVFLMVVPLITNGQDRQVSLLSIKTTPKGKALQKINLDIDKLYKTILENPEITKINEEISNQNKKRAEIRKGTKARSDKEKAEASIIKKIRELNKKKTTLIELKYPKLKTLREQRNQSLKELKDLHKEG